MSTDIQTTGNKKLRATQKPPKPDSIRKYIRQSLYAADLPPIDISDPVQVDERCRQYIEYCEKERIHPVIIGMGAFIGVHRDTVRNWMNGVYKEDTHLGIIKKWVTYIDYIHMSRLASGDGDTISSIYVSKATLGYRDSSDINVNLTVNPLGEPASPEELDEIKQRYLTD